jgi:hypothetical protein
MSTEDAFAHNRPQKLKNPYRPIGWAMLVRGIVVVVFGFWTIITIGPALKAGRYESVVTLLLFGLAFIAWGGRAISRGTAIAIRFGVRPSAPSDLADRVDPQTGQAIGYGEHAYALSDLRYMFLRKELPGEQNHDLIDQLLFMLSGRQPQHLLKRELVIDVLRGAVASTLLLAAFIVAFGVTQFEPAMRGQIALMNLIFLIAFILVAQYWGTSREAHATRRSASLGKLLFHMAVIAIVAVTLPVWLGEMSSVAALFARLDLPNPFDLLIILVVLGAAALGLTLLIVWSESRRFALPDKPTIVISEAPPVEAYGRLLPKDLLNAFARFVAGSRTLSLDDRVYSFSETTGQGGEGQPSDHGEFIAESAPLVRLDRLVSDVNRWLLVAAAILGEVLSFLAALLVFQQVTVLTGIVRQVFLAFKLDNFAAVAAPGSSVLVSLLLALMLAKFGNLFRELAIRFLGEVVFHSLMISISIASSVLPGRAESSVTTAEGVHLFDAGRMSILRLRIQTASLQTATVVSSAGGADSLGAPRYIIDAQREDRLMNALGQEAYRYIRERTGAATTRVQSETVELKNATHLLVDSGSGAAFFGVPGQTALPDRSGSVPFLDYRERDDEDEPGAR